VHVGRVKSNELGLSSEQRKELIALFALLLSSWLRRKVWLFQRPTRCDEELCVEKDFCFNITENIVIRGFIDRLDFDDDAYHIVDYKTTKDKKWMEPFQLSVYGLWLKEEYGVDDFKGSYVMLRDKSSYLSYNLTKKKNTKKK
jgi:RecB family exonuclease